LFQGIRNAASGGGSGSGNGTPVPNEVTASNGLRYQSHTKHTPGGLGNNPRAGIEPRNSLSLFEESVPHLNNPRVRFAFENGEIHRFSGQNGLWHWNGTTHPGNVPISASDIPISIRRGFGFDSKGR